MKEITVDMNLDLMLRRNAKHYPNKTAVVFGDTRLTYKEFNLRVNRTANALQNLGVSKCDKVAMMLSNSLEMLDLFWAVAKIGAVIVPLNPMVKGKDLSRLINDCEATTVVVSVDYLADLEAVKPELAKGNGIRLVGVGEKLPGAYLNYREITGSASPEQPNVLTNEWDPYNIMYSSGTTGLPKGIVHTHRTRIMYAFLWGMEYGVTFDSVVMGAGSLVFNGSLAYMFPTICAGATYVLLPKFKTELAANVIQKEKVTHTMLVPTQIISLLDLPDFGQYDLSSLQVLLSLGAPLPVERKKEVMQKLPGILYELYGLTEGFLTTLRPDDLMRKLGSVGPPMIFNEHRIVDDNMNPLSTGKIGEIVGRGPTIMTGYYHNEDATAQAMNNGWLKTGDIAWEDDEGFIYLVDRKKDMIISGGVNVYPKDIEEVAARHPDVSEVAVFGIPDPKWGEIPMAHVILKVGAEISDKALQEWINENITAKYQRLKGLKIVNDFPRNAAGKILKREMRDVYWRETKI